MMDLQGQPYDNHLPISGFTPINVPCAAFANDLQEDQPTDTNIESLKQKSNIQKRRKNAAPKTKSAQKTQKSTGVRKPRKTKAAANVQCQGDSLGFPVSKPDPSANRAPSRKNKISSDFTLIGDHSDRVLPSEAAIENRFAGPSHQPPRSQLSGLTETYQAAYAIPFQKIIDPGLLNKGCGLPIDPEDLDAVVTTGNLHNLEGELSSTQRELSLDFMIPPSAQSEIIGGVREKALSVERDSSVKSVFDDFFKSDDVFGDNSEIDDFPITEDGLAEAMQSIDPSRGSGKTIDDDWRRQQCPDELWVFQGQTKNDWQQGETFSSSTLLNDNKSVDRLRGKQKGRLQVQDDASPRILSQTSGNAVKIRPHERKVERPPDSFDDDELDKDLADMTVDGSDIIQLDTSPAKPSTPQLQWMPSKTCMPAKSSQSSASPINAPHHIPVNKNGDAIPFTRPPFPKPIQDRSPVLGLTNQTVLRTCFRIGEALNAAALASRSHTTAIIELYTRIVFSERATDKAYKQTFQFGDLFTDKPPYLSATYSLWKGVELWDVDARAFLGEKGRGKMARVMGRIQRCERGGGWEMTVLSIWEVDWEDVGVAKGIVCS